MYYTRKDLRFLKLSEHISSWSKDISTKVGAVIVNEEGIVVSMGYNGFCIGADDSLERIENRDEKIANTIHAEENAVLFADRHKLKDSILYTWPFQPCAKCSNVICQVGIKTVVSLSGGPERWQKSFEQAKKTFIDREVELILYPQDYLHEIQAN